jgi:phosphoribosylaminoimidazole (AIR) synthetase
MLRTFNMGIGMMLIVAERKLNCVTALLTQAREKFWIIGEIQRGKPSVKYIGDI